MEIDWVQVITVAGALASGGVVTALAAFAKQQTTKNALLVAGKTINILIDSIEEADSTKVKARVNNKTKEDPEAKSMIDNVLKDKGCLGKNN